MLYQITDGTVSLGGKMVLSHIDFEIKGSEKTAIVGENGAGKTTLLKLLAGEIGLDRDDRRKGPGIYMSRRLSIGMLRQQPLEGERVKTVEELLLESCPAGEEFSWERYEYEKEYDILFTGFGFAKKDKTRLLGEFSGGQQTRIMMIRLLLQKPDILLLDEPTNHLDMETVQWLEGYIRRYEHAIVMVSHDRYFLDQTADVVYELSENRLRRYPGNYTNYRQEKLKRLGRQQRAYEQQQEEIRRQEELIGRFRNKPAKAAFVRSRKKLLERIQTVEKPETGNDHIFTGKITPLLVPGKRVLEMEHVKIGYGQPILEISIRILRGQKVGVLGPNGAGKTTFLKTVAGLVPPLSGSMRLGNRVTIGYFDQHSAEISSEKSVLEHFHELFPVLTEKEARQILGGFLFGGRRAQTKVSALSGGEKARLVLAELLQSRPNFLVLDEPTNHMDIQAKETLESAFRAYEGTILFVSHDRYFLDRVADCMMIFGGNEVMYYPFGYGHYAERLRKDAAWAGRMALNAAQPGEARAMEAQSGEARAMEAQPGEARAMEAQPGGAWAGLVTAEDEALIAGIRAVPRAERQRLREIPEEEAYADWKMRLAGEKLAAAASWAGECHGRVQEAEEREWERLLKDTGSTSEVEPFCEEYRQAWAAWHEACMEWYDYFLETSPDCPDGS